MKTVLKRKILITMAFALMFVLGFGTVGAEAAPNEIKVVRAEILKDYVTNHEYGFTVFTTDDNKILYCVDPDKKALSDGQSATFSKNGDAGLLYLLQNGYPNKSLTGGEQSDKYVTQAAIWWYMDETGQAGKFSDDFKNATQATDVNQYISKYIKPMVEVAKVAKDTQVAPSIKLSSNGNIFTLTSDGKYYESPYMSATVVGTKTYEVSVSGGTKNTEVVDEKGDVHTTYDSSARFKIRVPALELSDSATITVKTSATGTVQKAKIYAPADTNVNQRVVGLYDETVDVNDSTQIYLAGGNASEVVDVPNTRANIVFWIVGLGILAIAVGVGVIVYADNKNTQKKKKK